MLVNSEIRSSNYARTALEFFYRKTKHTKTYFQLFLYNIMFTVSSLGAC